MKDFAAALEERLTTAIDAGRAPARRPFARRLALAAAPLAATVLAAVALLPGGAGGPTDRRSAADVLGAAAAVAAEQRGLRGFDGYRYVRQTFSGTRAVTPRTAVTERQAREVWVDARWDGEVVWEPNVVEAVHGDGADLEHRAEQPAGRDRFRLGDEAVFRRPVDALPAEPAALARALEAAHAERLDEPVAPERLRWELLSGASDLLGVANASAELRAAAFRMLAAMEGARALGEVTDSRGRTGVGVELPDRVGGTPPGDPQVMRLVIDPATSELLETTVTGTYGADRLTTRQTFEAAGRVARIGDRP